MFDFGIALSHLRAGQRVQRTGWNDKGMFLFHVPVWTYTDGKQDNFPNLPFIAMKTADNKVVPWLASQTDILASDWQVPEASTPAMPRQCTDEEIANGTCKP